MMMVETKRKGINFNVQAFIDNRYFIISILVLLFGKFLGALCVSRVGQDGLRLFENVVHSFLDTRTQNSFIKLFFILFLNSLCYVLVIMFSSLGVIGLPVIPVTLLIKGVGEMIVSGVLYRNYSLQGIAFSNLILLPSSLIVDFTLIYFSSKCFELSLKFASVLKDVSSSGVFIRTKCVSCIRACVIAIVLIIVAALVETALTIGFVKYFQF